MSDNQIGWQKYEDMLEQQMQSPMLTNLYKSFYNTVYEAQEELAEFADEFTEEELEQILKSQQKEEQVMLPIDDKMVENINLVTNFDCWMGHTNFNITESIKEALNKTEGVEALKICSRYRFFVGIGKMFDFKEVRRNIENTLLRGENIE